MRRPGLRRDHPAPQGTAEKALRAARSSDEWRSLYRRRSAVEREFGPSKHSYGRACLRLRGIERVRLHADLTMLGRRALALAKARAVPPRGLVWLCRQFAFLLESAFDFAETGHDGSRVDR